MSLPKRIFYALYKIISNKLCLDKKQKNKKQT